MRQRRLAVWAALLAIPVAALAGPLKTAWVPAEATWVVHMDVEAGVNSTLGRYAIATEGPWHTRECEEIRLRTGLDLAKDIRGVTLFGASCDPADAVAIIDASAATDSFLDKLRAQEPSFRVVRGEKFALDSWTEHGSPRFGFVRKVGADQRLIMISRDRARLEQAIELTDAPAAAPGPLLESVPRNGSVLFIAASDLDSARHKATALIVQNMKGLRLDMGEAAGELFGEMVVATERAEDAEAMLRTLQGNLALGQMLTQRQPALAPLGELSQSVSFATSGASVTVSFRHDSERAVAMLQKMEQAMKPRLQKSGNENGDGSPR